MCMRCCAAEAFDYPFFGTYAHATNGANYLRGANFAYAGATANATAFITPFYLNLQVDLFLNFKNVTLNPQYRKLNPPPLHLHPLNPPTILNFHHHGKSGLGTTSPPWKQPQLN